MTGQDAGALAGVVVLTLDITPPHPDEENSAVNAMTDAYRNVNIQDLRCAQS